MGCSRSPCHERSTPRGSAARRPRRRPGVPSPSSAFNERFMRPVVGGRNGTRSRHSRRGCGMARRAVPRPPPAAAISTLSATAPRRLTRAPHVVARSTPTAPCRLPRLTNSAASRRRRPPGSRPRRPRAARGPLLLLRLLPPSSSPRPVRWASRQDFNPGAPPWSSSPSPPPPSQVVVAVAAAVVVVVVVVVRRPGAERGSSSTRRALLLGSCGRQIVDLLEDVHRAVLVRSR